MKNLLSTLSLVFFVYLAHGQGIFKKESNWQDSKNGVSYEMNIWAKSAKDANQSKSLMVLKTIGNAGLLDKIELLTDGKIKQEIPFKLTEIQLDSGKYLIKLYHKKLGEKEFEFKLEKGQRTNIQLTVK